MTHIVKSICHFPNVRMNTNAFREKAFAGSQSGRIQKQIVTLLEELQARFDHFQELKPWFAFLVNPRKSSLIYSVMAIQFANRLSQTCLLCKRNWLALKNVSQCHYTDNFWPQVPENSHNWKDLCTTHFCIQHYILLWLCFSVMKFVKSNHRGTLKMNPWEN